MKMDESEVLRMTDIRREVHCEGTLTMLDTSDSPAAVELATDHRRQNAAPNKEMLESNYAEKSTS
jgi:hypothetical protein